MTFVGMAGRLRLPRICQSAYGQKMHVYLFCMGVSIYSNILHVHINILHMGMQKQTERKYVVHTCVKVCVVCVGVYTAG